MRRSDGSTEALGRLSGALAGRSLIWFGIRGEDGAALAALPEFSASFALTAPLPETVANPEVNVALEQLSGVRPDLDDPGLDVESGAPAEEFRRRLRAATGAGAAVLVTYRSNDLASELVLTSPETLTLAGALHQRQAAFDLKPWVDVALEQSGVRGLGWLYYSPEQRTEAERVVAGRPHILRASRTSGGAGLALLRGPDDVKAHWPAPREPFVALAPYLDGAVPINFSGCVFADGSVRLHPVSVQLIGVPACTQRRFGYCGNDFERPRSLDQEVLTQLDELAHQVGSWLFTERYLGAFGVDALVHENVVYFTEINPRFQGSSHLSATLADEMGVPNLFLDHLAATLGLPPSPATPTLIDWARDQRATAQVIVHNTAASPLRYCDDGHLDGAAASVSQLGVDVEVAPGGTLARLEFAGSVTDSGFDLHAEPAGMVERVRHSFGRA